MDNTVALILTLCLLSSIPFLLLTTKRSSGRRRRQLERPVVGVPPPGPWKLPIIGNLHQLLASPLPHRRLAELARKHGPLMQVELGEISTVVASSPKWAKLFMNTHDVNFATRPSLPAARILLYDGRDIAFGPPGDYWKKMRKVCATELLGPKRVKALRPLMEEEISKMMGSITSSLDDHQGVVNLTQMLRSLGNAVTTRAAFGDSSSTEKQRQAFAPFMRQIMWALGGFDLVDVFPSSKLLRRITRFDAKLTKLHTAADAILEAIIDDHVAARSTKQKEDEDLVDVLLNLKEENNDNSLGFPFTNLEIKAVILDIFLAGTETWTVTTGWAMSELMKNPEVMQKAQKEVRQVFDRKGKGVDEAGIGELRYLELVLKETLRLHPAGPLLIPRECQETMVLDGYRVPAKTRVIVNVWAIGRDPYYWTEPESFNPERFLGTSIDYKGQDFQLLPFGAGRRVCPGMHYGLAIVKLVLANLLYHFDWKLPNGIMPKDFDMTERFGSEVGRKNDLVLIPIPYHPT